MGTHNIHGTEVGFHSSAEGAKDFLRGDKDEARKLFEEAGEHGKAHFEADGKKFTVIHNKEEGTYHIRPSNI